MSVSSNPIAHSQGRWNVMGSPPKLPASVVLVSGHHGVIVDDEANRIIVDGCAGHADRPLAAVVFPERTLVDDTAGS